MLAAVLGRWLEWLRPTPTQGTLETIWVAATAGAPMSNRHQTHVDDAGLEGDRYALGRGHWHPVESCPVTLICRAELDRAARRARRLREPAASTPGEHRRNLVITGLRRSPHEGVLVIGQVRFAILRPRPPCGWLNQVVGYNLARALGRDSGICLRTLESGILQVGDPVRWEPTSTATASKQ
nr:MOSC domain-containing protein [Thioalkalivibrio sp. ALJ1]